MAKPLLPDNVTLADLAPRLKDAETYVRQVFRNMCSLAADRDTLVLRIGRTGTGKSPHYRVDRRTTGSFDGDEAAERFAFVADFNGLSHLRLVANAEPENVLGEAHWSDACMSFSEMQALLRGTANNGRYA